MLGELEPIIIEIISIIGLLIDIFGVVIIVMGIAWATYVYLTMRIKETDIREREYKKYKIRIGRALILGLEILVAADIIKTVAIEPTFENVGILAFLVVVRTFLSWTLILELEGRWPWQPELNGE